MTLDLVLMLINLCPTPIIVFFKLKISQVWWCPSVIPSTLEAETERITVDASLGKKLARPFLNQQARYGWCESIIPALWEYR
jgi:hypothetical protein